MKKILIIGWISAASTITYYEKLNDKNYIQSNDLPKVIIYSLNFTEIEELQKKWESEAIASIVIDAIWETMNWIVIDWVVIASNTTSIAEKYMQNIPIISIFDATGRYMNSDKKYLLLGTNETMTNPYYKNRFGKYAEIIVPNSNDRQIVSDVIYNKLCKWIIEKWDAERITAMYNEYKVDWVILWCTELPLLLSEEVLKSFDIPVYIDVIDTVECHLQRILEFIKN